MRRHALLTVSSRALSSCSRNCWQPWCSPEAWVQRVGAHLATLDCLGDARADGRPARDHGRAGLSSPRARPSFATCSHSGRPWARVALHRARPHPLCGMGHRIRQLVRRDSAHWRLAAVYIATPDRAGAGSLHPAGGSELRDASTQHGSQPEQLPAAGFLALAATESSHRQQSRVALYAFGSIVAILVGLETRVVAPQKAGTTLPFRHRRLRCSS
jgi:hypothetical protein